MKLSRVLSSLGSTVGVPSGVLSVCLLSSSVQAARPADRCYCPPTYCPPGYAQPHAAEGSQPSLADDGAQADGGDQVPDLSDAIDATDQAPYTPAAAGPAPTQLTASSPAGLAPNMLGDLYNASGTTTVDIYSYDDWEIDGLPSVGGAPGIVVGRQKITDNSSPIPRDRILNNFSYFNDTGLTPTGQDVYRNTIGFEKTFFDRLTSVEFRVPFAHTLHNDLVLSPGGDVMGSDGGELGNMTVYFKALLMSNSDLAVGAGLGVTIPTADDFTGETPGGVPLFHVENESAHLLPYLGFIYSPGGRFFTQGFLQFDFDSRGNTLTYNNGGGMTTIGDRFKDADYVFVDLGVGYWLFRDTSRYASGITGIAPTLEVHYNGDIDEPDTFENSDLVITSPDSFDLVNLLVGATIEVNRNQQISLGYVTPVGGDEVFDGELRLNWNWYFGAAPWAPASY